MKRSAAWLLTLICFTLLINCQPDNQRNFIEYLKAEKQIRSSVNDQQELHNKIAELQERYKIDPEAEIAKLNRNEKQWVIFLTELSRAR